jgi:hypothetical protein
LWQCNYHLWKHGVAIPVTCDLDFGRAFRPIVFLGSFLPLSPVGNIFFSFFIIFFISILSSHRRKAIERPSSHLVWSRPSISLIPFLSLSPSLYCCTRHSFLPLLTPDNASSNISPLAFPRFRLDPSRSGLRSTRTPQLLDGDSLPSPGGRKTAHGDSDHYDGADD